MDIIGFVPHRKGSSTSIQEHGVLVLFTNRCGWSLHIYTEISCAWKIVFLAMPWSEWCCWICYIFLPLCYFHCADDDRTGNSPAGGPGSMFHPDVKSRTLGSDYDLSEHDQSWELKGKKVAGATGGWSSITNQKGSPGASSQKTLPEQLKVFKGEDLSGYKPTSPKNSRMLYSGSSHNSSSRPSFPGSFFPLESSPRHQRRAVNISEPFAVSVPLRVSAVISSNSTPCRGHAKDKAATLKPCKETSEQSTNSGKSNTFPNWTKEAGRNRQEKYRGADLWSSTRGWLHLPLSRLKWLVQVNLRVEVMMQRKPFTYLLFFRYKQRSEARRRMNTSELKPLSLQKQERAKMWRHLLGKNCTSNL